MVAIATTHQRRVPSRPVLVVLPPVTRPDARVYRRRRLAVLCAALSILALPALGLAAGSSSTTIPPASAPTAPAPAAAPSVYVVQPGDTLWSIAQEVDPSGDPRAVVDRLVELNGTSSLQPGQRLRLTGQ